jgi:acetyl-CoA carboxylase biotin carboxyl carrier protein
MTDADSSPAAPDRELIQAVWDEAHDLVKRLEGSTVQRLRVEAGDYKIEIERGSSGSVVASAAASAPGLAGDVPAAGGEPAAEPDTRHAIVAPLVGTFYRASEPGAKPFVEEGDVVDEGQTVAIVEAMKLMNHVNADRSGQVAEIVVSDGEWVEFEQVLIYLEPVAE